MSTISMSNKKILITGGNGFIGASLAQALLRQGHCVHLLDMQSEPCGTALALGLPAFGGFGYFQGDVSELASFSELSTNYTHVVHAAAVLGIQRVCEESVLTLRVNIVGTENCLRFASRQSRLERFLSFSTSEIYGQSASECIETDDAVVSSVGARWCYAASKLAAEQLTMAYGREFGIPYVIVRPFNVYGTERLGPNALSTLMQNAFLRETITLSGTGQQTRAWCHVDDFVDGLIRCLFRREARNQVFNLGNPHERFSMIQLAQLVCEVVGSAVPILVSGSKEPDVRMRSPNIDKAKFLLGFEPVVSLREGLQRFAAALASRKSTRKAA